MVIEDFNRTLEIWIEALEQYNVTALYTKPSPTSWSIGQMYMHLIEDTKYYIAQIKVCVSSNNHINEEASPNAKTMFLHNDFPDEALEGAPSNANIPQPDTKEQLIKALLQVKAEMNEVSVRIFESPFHGKTKHPGLGYFSAIEWLQFAEMHFRHHLRQKTRIDDFLKKGYL